jgi:hypothetical protein
VGGHFLLCIVRRIGFWVGREEEMATVQSGGTQLGLDAAFSASPIVPSDRIAAIDIVRGIALFGVMAMNVGAIYHQRHSARRRVASRHLLHHERSVLKNRTGAIGDAAVTASDV